MKLRPRQTLIASLVTDNNDTLPKVCSILNIQYRLRSLVQTELPIFEVLERPVSEFRDDSLLELGIVLMGNVEVAEAVEDDRFEGDVDQVL